MTPHGFKDASADPEQLRSWAERWPDANTGTPTGAVSGIVVIDVDPGHGGLDSLARWEATHGTLPACPTVRTGGGGLHLYFAHPGHPVANRAGLAEGIDVRGDGGYVVAPPSVHNSGARYAWEPGCDMEDLDPPPLPPWLAAMLMPRRGVVVHAPASNAWSERALREEVSNLANAAEGTRDHTLMRSAFKLGQITELDAGRITVELHRAAGQCGLLEELGEDALLEKIARGIAAGAASPRGPLESRGIPGANQPAPSTGPDRFHLTDMGNAERLVRRYGHDLHYCYRSKRWLTWDGRRFAEDDGERLDSLAKDTARQMLTDASLEPEKEERAKRVKWALISETDRRLNSMLALSRSEPGVPVKADALDADPWTLNVLNGTIDLKTGLIEHHDRSQLLTKLAPARYEPGARSGLWERFLEQMVPDPAVRDFLQRAAGYSLTGSTAEEVLFFVHGPAAAGKSTFTEALRAVIGDYAKTAEFSTFLKRRDEGPRNDVASLGTARMVLSLEMEEGRSLAEALVKHLTGGDTISARFLYQESFEFKPVFKLWLVANHRPKASSGDAAIWRRILLVPFTEAIPREQRSPAIKLALTTDPDVRSAILAWAVQGCLSWQRSGLQPAEAVLNATANYRLESDHLAVFLEETFGIDTEIRVGVTDMKRKYQEWAKANVEHTIKGQRFIDGLKANGLEQSKSKSERFWRRGEDGHLWS